MHHLIRIYAADNKVAFVRYNERQHTERHRFRHPTPTSKARLYRLLADKLRFWFGFYTMGWLLSFDDETKTYHFIRPSDNYQIHKEVHTNG